MNWPDDPDDPDLEELLRRGHERLRREDIEKLRRDAMGTDWGYIVRIGLMILFVGAVTAAIFIPVILWLYNLVYATG